VRYKKLWIIFLLFLIVFLSGLWYGIKGKGFFSDVLSRVITPVWETGGVLGEKLRSFFEDYVFLISLKEENKRLKEEIQILKQRIVQYETELKQCRVLERFYKASKKISYPKISARIIYKPFDPFSGVIFIDKGSEDNLLPQMPVVAPAGDQAVALVGQVVEVYKHWSKVILLTDPSFAADVKILSTGDRGILKGRGEAYCNVEYLPSYTRIKPGDEVVTSGEDALFPPGLLVGKVVSVSKKDGVFKVARVKPVVNLYNLDIVFILIKMPEIPM